MVPARRSYLFRGFGYLRSLLFPIRLNLCLSQHGLSDSQRVLSVMGGGQARGVAMNNLAVSLRAINSGGNALGTTVISARPK